jgi:hypothetical protein
MRAELEKLGGRISKRYRIFQKKSIVIFNIGSANNGQKKAAFTLKAAFFINATIKKGVC